jgi:hypothetical protein
MLGAMPVDPDLALRQAAITRAQELSGAYDGLVPLAALRKGFRFRGQRISFGSFYKGIHHPKELESAAALTLMTAAERPSGRGRRGRTKTKSTSIAERSCTTIAPER